MQGHVGEHPPHQGEGVARSSGVGSRQPSPERDLIGHEERRLLVCRRGAADVSQKARVIAVGEVGRGQPDHLAHADSEHGRPQRLAVGLAHAQVGDVRQGRENFCEAQTSHRNHVHNDTQPPTVSSPFTLTPPHLDAGCMQPS